MDVSRKNSTLIFDHLMLRNFLKFLDRVLRVGFYVLWILFGTSPVSCILVHPVEYHAV